MLAADDGKPETLAPVHALKLIWDDAGGKTYDSMFPIAEAGYHARGGKNPRLPGNAAVTKGGRADARLAVDANGELYLYTKSDGMIRVIVGASGF